MTLHANQSTLRFFRHHRWLTRGRTRPIALREIRRAQVWVRVVRRELAETRAALRPKPRSVPAIICQVFGQSCSKAVAVARCESTLSVYARNGQYVGLFQMGARERQMYGGSSMDAWEQTRAAYAYYRRAGWGPWECA